MRMCDRGIQMLITTLGAFAAFSLMTIAVGTDYWLYSRGVCRTKSTNDNDTSRKNEEVMTHSGLWRTCCLEDLLQVLRFQTSNINTLKNRQLQGQEDHHRQPGSPLHSRRKKCSPLPSAIEDTREA
ncbi:Voltage-dependent calcium channel gamma-3 subunit [Podarcis lilfordi]|uniref:Voltage-dependent calcium channel gamma-3 subunit n=1 Tax=Podarcis lilfordi TaxID=74358 RepID=A0AA35LAS3_9SAUR|nr:Voltage-dependent calcium channel gamma-3 subunit [Podarcis lilfordi]